MPAADEIETKFAVADFGPVRQALAQAGGLRLSRRFEENIVFDTPQRSLRGRGILLRLRRDGAGRLTLKLPSETSGAPGIKIRRELETKVADADALAAILSGLGYEPALRYEKVRETWRLEAAEVCLDELPFGLFLEIEGPAAAIPELAGRLGLSMEAASALTYHDLYQEHLRACGLPPGDSFVFAPEARRAILETLSDAS